MNRSNEYALAGHSFNPLPAVAAPRGAGAVLLALTVLWVMPSLAHATDALGGHLDTLVFADDASEQAHSLHSSRSQAIDGAMGSRARQLVPLEPVSFQSGTLNFVLKVDPKQQTYFTVKLWGSDCGADHGRLILLSGDRQIGYRDQGDYDVLNQTDEEPEAPGRFLYVTIPLPPSLTRDKTTLPLTLLGLGRMWPYGTNFAQYQKDLTEPTRGIYQVYTHTKPRFVPEPSEKQGALPTPSIRPGPGEEVIGESKEIVNNRLAKMLASLPNASKRIDHRVRCSRLLLLAEAYDTPWSAAHADPRAIEQILRDGDAMVRDAAADPLFVSRDWIGAGPLGEAVMRVWPAVAARMAEGMDSGSAGRVRRQAWAALLRASIDYWRTHRRAYTNQSMIVDRNIYTANRALRLIDPKRALPEAKVLRFLYEAVGIEPWLGSDPSDDGAGLADVPGKGTPKCFGEHYQLVTRKGLSRELGYVGTYGETILHFTHDIAELTADERFRQQLRKLESARMYFRYPGTDSEGYHCMKLASEIDNRTAHDPLAGAAYTAPNIREEWWMDVPALLADDPVSVGAAQQSLAENQYFAYIKGRLADPDTLGMMRNVDEYEKVKALPPSSYRLPMSDGQPDVVFADEEDAVLALKHGDERLFINFYYRAERGVNGVARVLELTPTLTRIATVRTQFELSDSGQTYVRPDWIDGIRDGGLPPPGAALHQAWAGEKLPIAARPDDAKEPKYGEFGPFVGKAEFYKLHYGNYLIGMNCTANKTFDLEVPENFDEAIDLVTGRPLPHEREIKVPPFSTVVISRP